MTPEKSTDRLADVHPKMLRVGSEPDRKNLADLRPVIGSLVSRTFELMGITKQAAAFAMGYSDPGTVSRWCSATERPLFDRLFTIPGFKVAYVQALAEHDPQCETATVITIRKSA